jgi:hypothetical protein
MDIEPVPVTGFAANFSPTLRMAPPPLGREIDGAGCCWPTDSVVVFSSRHDWPLARSLDNRPSCPHSRRQPRRLRPRPCVAARPPMAARRVPRRRSAATRRSPVSPRARSASDPRDRSARPRPTLGAARRGGAAQHRPAPTPVELGKTSRGWNRPRSSSGSAPPTRSAHRTPPPTRPPPLPQPMRRTRGQRGHSRLVRQRGRAPSLRTPPS